MQEELLKKAAPTPAERVAALNECSMFPPFAQAITLDGDTVDVFSDPILCEVGAVSYTHLTLPTILRV